MTTLQTEPLVRIGDAFAPLPPGRRAETLDTLLWAITDVTEVALAELVTREPADAREAITRVRDVGIALVRLAVDYGDRLEFPESHP